MRPEIEAYLRDHGATYTTDALRAQLIRAGHDPAEVDAALAETEQARLPQLTSTKGQRSRFWRLAFLFNVAVLVGVTILTLNSTYAGLISVVLGIALLIGLAISGSIGRLLLPRSGLLVALILPVVAALLLGGWCFAMMGDTVAIRPVSTAGTFELHLDPPLDFTGTGTALCDKYVDQFIVSAHDLGAIDGRLVIVSVGSVGGHPDGSVLPSHGTREVYVEIDILDETNGSGLVYALRGPELPFPFEATEDGRSGEATFEGLPTQPSEPSPTDAPESISGTLSWSCR